MRCTYIIVWYCMQLCLVTCGFNILLDTLLGVYMYAYEYVYIYSHIYIIIHSLYAIYWSQVGWSACLKLSSRCHHPKDMTTNKSLGHGKKPTFRKNNQPNLNKKKKVARYPQTIGCKNAQNPSAWCRLLRCQRYSTQQQLHTHQLGHLPQRHLAAAKKKT